MGMSAKDWDALIREAGDLAGGNWSVVGKGRRAYLLRTPVRWWAQFIRYENTSTGLLVAYQGLLSYPLPRTECGMDGITQGHLRDPDLRKSFAGNPGLVAAFAEAATDLVYREKWSEKGALEISERYFRKNCEAGIMETIYQGFSRQLLVAQRVLCRSRPQPDLQSDVQWVLDDPQVGERIWDDRSADFGKQATIDYWRAVADRLDAADSDGLNELLLAQRRKTLLGLGLSEDLIGTPDLPEPEVAW